MDEGSKGFDLQLFADGDELSIDDAVSLLSGETVEPTEESTSTENENNQPETVEQNEENQESEQQQEEESQEETPQIDFTAKVKFKANGQEVEKSIQDLINDAQLASNYNQKMQELSQQRKAFEMANQQQQPQQVNPLKEFEDLNNEVTARAMKMLGITDPELFVPDAMGIMGDKVHYAAYQKALLDVQHEKQAADYEQQQIRVVEENYYSTVNSFQSEPDFQDVNKFAVDSLFQLPQKGEEGVKEFQKLYGIYQKTQLREQHWQETQQYGRSNIKLVPFTPTEIKELEKFYNSCKAEYHAQKVKTQVKSQVPKNIPIRPTVKTESTGGNETPPPKKLDIKKIREMSKDDIAKLL
jgi:hypothetical protein